MFHTHLYKKQKKKFNFVGFKKKISQDKKNVINTSFVVVIHNPQHSLICYHHHHH